MSHHQIELIRKDVDQDGRVEFTFSDSIAIQFENEDAVIAFCDTFVTPVDLMRQFAIAYSTDHGGLGQCLVTYDLNDANGDIVKASG